MLTLKEMLGSPSAGKPKHHDSEKEELSLPFSAKPLPGENSFNSIWNKIPSYFKTITDPLNHSGVQDIGQGTNQTP